MTWEELLIEQHKLSIRFLKFNGLKENDMTEEQRREYTSMRHRSAELYYLRIGDHNNAAINRLEAEKNELPKTRET